MKYEIRQIDACMYDGEWVENTSYLLGKYTTHAQDEGRAFLNFLRRKVLPTVVSADVVA